MACRSNASSISARMALVHGSAPHIAILSELCRGSTPWAGNCADTGDVEPGLTKVTAGRKAADRPPLPLGHAPRPRHARHAQTSSPMVKADTAGEQAVAVGILHQHPRLT